ncbi:MAG: hypothetical protein IPJ88_02485 [Myxococcales bacterium]|nr:MAG: hypothetical protein IPJ88_02485 [Myxococcales bacterium]
MIAKQGVLDGAPTHDFNVLVLGPNGETVRNYGILSEEEFHASGNKKALRDTVHRRLRLVSNQLHITGNLMPLEIQRHDGHEVARDGKLVVDLDLVTRQIAINEQGQKLAQHKIVNETPQGQPESCRSLQPHLSAVWADRLHSFLVLRISFTGRVDSCVAPPDRVEVMHLDPV